jgi:hypothetical protein
VGHDRAVLRWDVHASLLRLELDQIERELARLDRAAAADTDARRARLENARRRVLSCVRALGPSPLAKMG